MIGHYIHFTADLIKYMKRELVKNTFWVWLGLVL